MLTHQPVSVPPAAEVVWAMKGAEKWKKEAIWLLGDHDAHENRRLNLMS